MERVRMSPSLQTKWSAIFKFSSNFKVIRVKEHSEKIDY